MSTWELIAYSTEERGETSVRHRRYTTSRRAAILWNRIPKIQFTDSGHGIVFDARRHTARARKPEITKHTGSWAERLSTERARARDLDNDRRSIERAAEALRRLEGSDPGPLGDAIDNAVVALRALRFRFEQRDRLEAQQVDR